METYEIVYLIENAEQGSDIQTIESGENARKQLNALLARIAELEEQVKNLSSK